MSAIANLIYQTMANRPDPAKSFIQGAGAAQNRALVNEQLQTSQAARQKQSALQQLALSGATPEQYAKAGFLTEAKDLKELNATPTTYGVFKDRKTAEDTAQKVADAYKKDAGQYLTTINYYNSGADTAKRAGGVEKMTGTDDFSLIRDYIKSTLPSEAVMTDDQIRATLAGGGYPGVIQNFWNTLKGGGLQGVEARKQMLTTMKNKADRAMIIRDKMYGQYSGRMNELGLNPETYLIQHQDIADLNEVLGITGQPQQIKEVVVDW